MPQRYSLLVITFSIVLATVAAGVAVRAEISHLLITRVQISGAAGHTADDFVELYNPTPQSVDLKGYRLVKRSAHSASDTNVKSWGSSVLLPPHSYYLWANSGYTNLGVKPNATTSATLSGDNAIALRQGAANSGTIVDSVAWGKAANGLGEGTSFPPNPGTGQMLQRKTADDNYQDTDSNGQDFSLVPSAAPHADEVQMASNTTTTKPTTSSYQAATAASLATLASGTKVEFTATVAAAPGTFGTSTAFVANPNVRLVLANKNYPTLTAGDQVRVRGVVSNGVHGIEVNVSSASGLARLGAGEAPAPQTTKLTDISSALANALVVLTGTVSKTTRTTFTITDQGKTLRVVFKNKQVDWPAPTLGDQATVAGLVVLSGSEAQLWPRAADDITFTEAPLPATQPLPAAAPKTESNSNGYLVLALAAAVIGGAYLWQRFQPRSTLERIKKFLTRRGT